MGTNCLGPFLFNKFLLPTLQKTAVGAPKGSVRAVWLSSMVTSYVPNGGIIIDSTGEPQVQKNDMENYMQSKVGNLFFAREMAKRYGGDGIVNVVCGCLSCFTCIQTDMLEQSVNPGLMKTELQRHNSPIQGMVMVR